VFTTPTEINASLVKRSFKHAFSVTDDKCKQVEDTLFFVR